MPPGNEEDENMMKILIATDCHVGYMEKDSIRGGDSFNSFEEILRIAQAKDVDMILLGGDLFHDNKPSRRALHGVMTLLRKYCLGDKACALEFRSDQSINFGHTPFPTVNYEDPNLNVGIPCFSIHGNHDDPTGQGNLCSLDLLSAAGLVNYFGKYTNLEKIEISPLLLQKGTTKLALYGLGSIRDERLHRMFVQRNVQMLRPKEEQDEWFNLLVLHQNRAKHTPTSYIPEPFLDDFLDLVLWGHEHECKIEPQWNGVQNFYVTQPGSSVATSLSEGETRKKHIGLLHIKGREFKLSKIPLKTVRQFYMKDIVLSETSLNPSHTNCARQVEEYCCEKVDSMLEQAEIERYGNESIPQEPLIRIRVDYSGGFECFNTYRFGQKFVNRVANPRDVVLFSRRKQSAATKDKKKFEQGDEDVFGDLRPESLDSARVEDMLRDYFANANQEQKMVLLTERGLGEAVKEFVDKEERDAIQMLVKHQLEKTQKHLAERKAGEESIDLEVSRYQEKRRGNVEDEEVAAAMKAAREKRTKEEPLDDNDDLSDMDDDAGTTSKRGRGGRGRGGRGRGTTTGRGRGRGRGRGAKGSAAGTQMSIQDTFAGASSRGRQYKEEPEVTLIDDDSDEDPFDRHQTASSRKRKPNGTSPASSSRSHKGKKGIMFGSEEEDDDLFNASKRRRR